MAGAVVFAIAVVTLAAAGRASAAGTDPLLVIVETAPGSGVEPGAVRRSIEKELGRKVVGPGDLSAGQSSQVLLIALDGQRVTISMRTADGTSPERTIPAPRDPGADLRAITWLAGNLARDQVGPIVAAPPLATAATRATEATKPATKPAAIPTTPPPLVVPDDPLPSRRSDDDEVGTIRANASSASAAAGAPRWTVTASGGPATPFTRWLPQNRFFPTDDSTWLYGVAYSLAIQRESAVDGLILGAVLDVGPDNLGRAHDLGAAALFGSRWVHPRWRLEGTVGVGIEINQTPVVTSTITDSTVTGPVKMLSVSSNGLGPALYARAVATLVVPISRTFDLTGSVGMHLTTTGIDSDFFSSTVGLRLRIP